MSEVRLWGHGCYVNPPLPKAAHGRRTPRSSLTPASGKKTKQRYNEEHKTHKEERSLTTNADSDERDGQDQKWIGDIAHGEDFRLQVSERGLAYQIR
ncbi:MAG TPA: hypothetical protein VJU86_20475 [Pyrinomonadaceae bacterium]|nr:hypothetical protein [Pyrinomonadaceae bacterium]